MAKNPKIRSWIMDTAVIPDHHQNIEHSHLA